MRDSKAPETWLVTGASRGIGFAVVSAHLAREGKVLANYRGQIPESLAELQDSYPERLTCLRFDLAQPQDIRRAAEQVTTPIDVLFNNAGVYGPRNPSFRDLDIAGTIDAFAINAVGTIGVIEAFCPHLNTAERPRIVAVSSLMGAMSKPGSGSLAYRMSKAALNRAMLAIGQDLSPKGIAVACLRPGHVRTDMTSENAPMLPQESARHLLNVVDTLKPSDGAVFLDITGERLSW